MSKKWASNDKDRLLVENFKKFMEEGDFSADEELNERSWSQMGKDIMNLDFMGKQRESDARMFAMKLVKKAYKMVRSGDWDNLDDALRQVADDNLSAINAAKRAAGEDFVNMKRVTFLKVMGDKVYKKYGGILSREEEEERSAPKNRGTKREEARQAAMASGDRRDWAEFKCKWDNECDEWDRMQYDSPTGREDKREKKLGGGYGGDHGGGYGRQHSAPWDE